jgi:hypothetical protein
VKIKQKLKITVVRRLVRRPAIDDRCCPLCGRELESEAGVQSIDVVPMTKELTSWIGEGSEPEIHINHKDKARLGTNRRAVKPDED